MYAFISAGKLDEDTRRLIKLVTEECKVCKTVRRSRPKPSVAISQAGDFNTIISMDLKSIGDKYILWMVCACTRFVKGVVVKNKQPETIIKALHEEWCLNVGFPTMGFWSNNGGEFRNIKMEEFVNKLA